MVLSKAKGGSGGMIIGSGSGGNNSGGGSGGLSSGRGGGARGRGEEEIEEEEIEIIEREVKITEYEILHKTGKTEGMVIKEKKFGTADSKKSTIFVKDVDDNVFSKKSQSMKSVDSNTESQIKRRNKRNESTLKNVGGTMLAITSIVSVSIIIKFVLVPQIPVPIPITGKFGNNGGGNFSPTNSSSPPNNSGNLNFHQELAQHHGTDLHQSLIEINNNPDQKDANDLPQNLNIEKNANSNNNGGNDINSNNNNGKSGNEIKSNFNIEKSSSPPLLYNININQKSSNNSINIDGNNQSELDRQEGKKPTIDVNNKDLNKDNNNTNPFLQYSSKILAFKYFS